MAVRSAGQTIGGFLPCLARFTPAATVLRRSGCQTAGANSSVAWTEGVASIRGGRSRPTKWTSSKDTVSVSVVLAAQAALWSMAWLKLETRIGQLFGLLVVERRWGFSLMEIIKHP